MSWLNMNYRAGTIVTLWKDDGCLLSKTNQVGHSTPRICQIKTMDKTLRARNPMFINWLTLHAKLMIVWPNGN